MRVPINEGTGHLSPSLGRALPVRPEDDEGDVVRHEERRNPERGDPVRAHILNGTALSGRRSRFLPAGGSSHAIDAYLADPPVVQPDSID